MTQDNALRSSNSDKTKIVQSNKSHRFALPRSLRQVFDKFPIHTFAPNPLPQRSPRSQGHHVLHIFQRDHISDRDAPSCNPTCLKWQAYLKFTNINFQTRLANNHASPTGALPFILPFAPSSPSSPSNRPSSPVAASKIAKWAESQGAPSEPLHLQEEAYSSLIDHVIRSAWLVFLYLDEPNFSSVAWPMYVASASNNGLVQRSIAQQLRTAAKDELFKTQVVLDEHELYKSADDALQALSTLLGEHDNFFATESPGLFDASFFAYSQILLDEDLEWQTTILGDLLRKYENLVQHRNRLLTQYFS